MRYGEVIEHFAAMEKAGIDIAQYDTYLAGADLSALAARGPSRN
jgi:hypothetical protein